MTLSVSTVRKWCPSQNPQGLGSLHLRCITKRWNTVDSFDPYTWHTNSLFNPFTNGQCLNNLSQNVELIQVFQHTNGCQMQTLNEYKSYYEQACHSAHNQNIYMPTSHSGMWHMVILMWGTYLHTKKITGVCISLTPSF